MSRQSFFTGLLAGGLIGMIATIAMAPRLKPDTRSRILETSKDWGHKAGKMWRRSRAAAEDAADHFR